MSSTAVGIMPRNRNTGYMSIRPDQVSAWIEDKLEVFTCKEDGKQYRDNELDTLMEGAILRGKRYKSGALYYLGRR